MVWLDRKLSYTVDLKDARYDINRVRTYLSEELQQTFSTLFVLKLYFC